MSLGVIYNVFEGTELLEFSIREIRDQVDFILVNYQKISYYNQPAKQEDIDQIAWLQRQKLIDTVLCFDPNNWNHASTPYHAKMLERTKRETGRIHLMNQGLTHFLHMDVDEFYKKDEFAKAKKFMEDNNLYYSACKIKEYMKLPTYQLEDYEDIQVPFICKNGPHVNYSGGDFITQTDPTRWYNSTGFPSYRFKPEEIVMHHMNNVRKDLAWKYQVTSRSNLNRENIPNIVNGILMLKEGMAAKGIRKIVTVPNYFGIDWSGK